MQNLKNDIHEKLLACGRDLLRSKGMEYLTARKLSEASGCSIGMIYSQFANMDEFAAEENEITLSELLFCLSKIEAGDDGYDNMLQAVNVFTAFADKNRELWFLLYNFHLNGRTGLSVSYKRKIIALRNFVNREFKRLFPSLENQKRKIVKKVFELGLFGLGAMISSEMFCKSPRAERNNLCAVFANTFLAGITLLEEK